MTKVDKIRCVIVTLCRSPNYGAFLQAFALKQILSGRGYKVNCLDIYDRDNNKKRYKVLYRGWKKQPRSIIFNSLKFLTFRSAEKKLEIVSSGDLAGCRAAFIGADEIWSVTNGTFNTAPEFFGLNMEGVLKLSYAPSVGNSGIDDIAKYPSYVEGLRNLDMISVRDCESLQVATTVIGRDDVSMVLDPTFLHDFSTNEEKITIPGRYILVYTYGFSAPLVEEVKAYARKNRLRIISAGFYHRWADKNYSCSPFQFLSLIKSSECVITDTFHGSIFAIKYRKNFLSYGRHKKKVKHLLESLGLHGSLVDPGFLSDRRSFNTDYSMIDERLSPLMAVSVDYLERCDALIRAKQQ